KNNFKQTFTSETECRDAKDVAIGQQARLVKKLEPFESATGDRLSAAIELLYEKRVGERVVDCDVKRTECEDLLPLVIKIQNMLPEYLELRNAHAALAALFGHLDGNEHNEILMSRIRTALEQVHERVLSIR